MKISSAALKNFGLFAEATVTFDTPIALILAKNGRGKTTLTQAIELGLRGQVHTLQQAKLDSRYLVGAADAPAYVALLLGAPDVAIDRKLTGSKLTTRLNAREATNDVFDFIAPPGLADASSVFRVICNVAGFLDQDEKQQKAVLLSLVDRAIPPTLLAGLPMEGRVGVPATIDALDAAYDAVYTARAGAKKTLAGIVVPAVPDRPRQDAQAIHEKIGLLRSQERAMIAQVGAVSGERAAVDRQRGACVDALDQTRIRIKELGARATLDATLTAAEAELAALRHTNERIKDGERERIDRQSRLQKFKDMDKGLAALGAVCVITSEVTCPLSLDKRTEVRAGFAKSIAVLKEQLAGARETPLHVTSAVERKIAAARKAIEQLEAAEKESERLNGEITALDARLRELPAEADPPALIDARDRIAKGEKNLKTAAEINAAHDAHEAATKKRAAVQADVEALERLCEAFGPKGIREQVLGPRLGALVERLNAVLTGFGLTLDFAQEPWRLLVNGRHPARLSASERFRAGVAFQIALAEATGIKWLLLDGADILDRTNRAALFGLLQEAVTRGLLDQAIVTATLTSDRLLQSPPGHPFGVYTIDEGQITRVLKVTDEALLAGVIGKDHPEIADAVARMRPSTA